MKSVFAIRPEDAPVGYRVYWKTDKSYSLEIYPTVSAALFAAGTANRNEVRVDPVWIGRDPVCFL